MQIEENEQKRDDIIHNIFRLGGVVEKKEYSNSYYISLFSLCFNNKLPLHA